MLKLPDSNQPHRLFVDIRKKAGKEQCGDVEYFETIRFDDKDLGKFGEVEIQVITK